MLGNNYNIYLLDDAFKLTIDTIFPPKYRDDEPIDSKYPVKKYPNNENLWYNN